MFAKYKANFLVEATEFERVQAGKLPEGWELSLPTFTAADSAKSTRQLSQGVLRKIVPVIPELMGGSADLTGSNLTKVDGNSLDYSKVDRSGRYLRFGVREHGMCAIANGMAA
jgi:transketolase